MLDAVLLQNFQMLPLVGPIPGPALPRVSSDGPAAGVPVRMELRQNYPNPFNPSTTVSFSTAGGGMSIRVYDTLGREVAVLLDGAPAAGEHTVTFDASALPAGVYFLRMRGDGFDEVRRMNFLR
jgi:hypothetical protein